MKVTRKQIEKCVDIGDEVYIICGSKIIMANVTAIHDDRITTDVDECFLTNIWSSGLFLEARQKTLLTRANNL